MIPILKQVNCVKVCLIGNFIKVTVYVGSDLSFGIVVNLFGWIKTYSCCKL